MLPDLDDVSHPAALARMLAAQAELLALNAAIESARGGARGPQLRVLAEQARALAERGREMARRHEQAQRDEQALGRLLDEGLARAADEADAIDHFLQTSGRAVFMPVGAGSQRHH